MSPRLFALVSLLGLLLASCSTVKKSASTVTHGASRALSATRQSTLKAYDKITGNDHGLKIVQADNRRFLPGDTRLENGQIVKPQPKRFLASNTTSPQVLPPLDLPPLPTSNSDTADLPGILPPLDDSGAPTTIDSDADLPPCPKSSPSYPWKNSRTRPDHSQIPTPGPHAIPQPS